MGLLVATPVSAQTNDDLLRAALVQAVDVITKKVNLLQVSPVVQTETVKSDVVTITPAKTTDVLQVKATQELTAQPNLELEKLASCMRDYIARMNAIPAGRAACKDGAKQRRYLEGWTKAQYDAEILRCDRVYDNNERIAETEFLICISDIKWGF